MRRGAGPPFLLSYVETWGIRMTASLWRAVIRMRRSHAATLGRTASVVRLGRHIVDGADLEASGLKRTDRRLATRTRALDEDVDLLHAVLLRLAGGRLGGQPRGGGGRLARALEADSAGRGQADDGTRGVGDRDDG